MVLYDNDHNTYYLLNKKKGGVTVLAYNSFGQNVIKMLKGIKNGQ